MWQLTQFSSDALSFCCMFETLHMFIYNIQVSAEEKTILKDKLISSSYGLSGITVDLYEFYKVSWWTSHLLVIRIDLGKG